MPQKSPTPTTLAVVDEPKHAAAALNFNTFNLGLFASSIGAAIDSHDTNVRDAAVTAGRVGMSLVLIRENAPRGSLAAVLKMLGPRKRTAQNMLRIATGFMSAEGLLSGEGQAQRLVDTNEVRDLLTGQLELKLGDQPTPLEQRLMLFIRTRSIAEVLADLSSAGDDDEPRKPKSLPTSGGIRTDGSDAAKKRELLTADAADYLQHLRLYVGANLIIYHTAEELRATINLATTLAEAASQQLAILTDSAPTRGKTKR